MFCPASLGSYYAVFSLALRTYTMNDDEPTDLQGRTTELADLYLQRSAQCLHRADLTVPTRSSIECLLLQTICEYARSSEGFLGQWMMLGVLVRKALSMGLHRDPSEFPGLSAYEGEIRRRLWSNIWLFDMLFSFSLGLPNSIQPSRTNVTPPVNVFEEELTEDMTELPPSRPHDENTSIGYTIAKLNVLRGLSGVIEHLNSVHKLSLDELEALNKKLQRGHDLIPEHLRIKPLQESVTASRPLRLQRLYLQMFHDKAACMLNRAFIGGAASHSATGIRSREICLQSALSMLAMQDEFERERYKWWLFHLTKHDFLLAAAVLYLVLFTKKRMNEKATHGIARCDQMPDEEDQRIHAALERSQAVWERTARERVSDASAAVRMFASMRSKLEEPHCANIGVGSATMPPPVNGDTPQGMVSEAENGGGDMAYSAFASFDQGLPLTSDFDWLAWDTSMQAPGFNSRDIYSSQ